MKVLIILMIVVPVLWFTYRKIRGSRKKSAAKPSASYRYNGGKKSRFQERLEQKKKERKIAAYADLTEKKFVAFAKTATDEMLEDFIDMLPESEKQFIDFTNNMWGHAYRPDDEKIGKYIWHGHCFHSAIIGSAGIRVGQNILVKVEAAGGQKTAVHKILFRKNVRDPRDMYWIYTIGTGYYEEEEKVKS